MIKLTIGSLDISVISNAELIFCKACWLSFALQVRTALSSIIVQLQGVIFSAAGQSPVIGWNRPGTELIPP